MPRFAICIFCTILAALIAVMLMLAPSPALAQAGKPASRVEFGQGEVVVGELRGRVLMLGSDELQPGFKLLAMARYADRSSPTREILSDESGAFTIVLRDRPSELRVFAFGEFVVPDAHSNIPIANMKFAAPEAWDVRVRRLRPVKLSGKVTREPGAHAGRSASISLAPLDIAADGAVTVFETPYRTSAEDDGSYRLEVPSGHYMLWASGWDASRKDLPGYICVVRRVDVFEDKVIDLPMREAPTIRGKVIDARTGQGIAARIDLYSNRYLRFLGIRCADGEMADEYSDQEGVEDIKWPVGTFKSQFWTVDPENFTAVIRPVFSQAVIRILPDLNLAELVDKEVVWTLFDEGMNSVDIGVTTHKHALPINQVDVQLLPRDVELPRALRLSFEAAGVTDDAGRARFVGLPRGEYEVYVSGGSAFVGKLIVDGSARQELTYAFRIPFAWGAVKLPGGEKCRNVRAIMTMQIGDGPRYGPVVTDAYKRNPELRKEGRLFVPLLQRATTFTLQFGAFEGGRDFEETEALEPANFPLLTDEMVIKVEGEEAWEIDLELKPNPNFKKREPRKPRGE